MSNIPQVFFSYSHDDKIALEFLLSDLGDEYDVWDDSHLKPGDNWENTIRGEIRRRPIFVVLVTESSVASEHVLKEVETAISSNSVIIPVVWKVASPPAALEKIGLDSFHAIILDDVGREEGIRRLKAQIEDPNSVQSRAQPYNLYFASVGRFAGITSVIVGLHHSVFRNNAGYFKPFVFTRPRSSRRQFRGIRTLSDPLLDVEFVKDHFNIYHDLSAEEIAPARLGQFQFHPSENYLDVIEKSFERIQAESRKYDLGIVLIEGVLSPPGGISLKTVLDVLNARLVVVIDPYEARDVEKDLLSVRELLGPGDPIAVVLNKVEELSEPEPSWLVDYLDFMSEYDIIPMGIIPFDERLCSISIENLVYDLDGEFFWPSTPQAIAEFNERLLWRVHTAAWRDDRAGAFFRKHKFGEGHTVITGERSINLLADIIRSEIEALIISGDASLDQLVLDTAKDGEVPIVHIPKETSVIGEAAFEMMQVGPFCQGAKVEIISEHVDNLSNRDDWLHLIARSEERK